MKTKDEIKSAIKKLEALAGYSEDNSISAAAVVLEWVIGEDVGACEAVDVLLRGIDKIEQLGVLLMTHLKSKGITAENIASAIREVLDKELADLTPKSDIQ